MPDAELELVTRRLGERLVHEQLAACYYGILACKAGALGAPAGGPGPEHLEELVQEERHLAELLRQTLIDLGGEPDRLRALESLEATVSATRLLALVADPRRSVLASMEALLVAELADRASWDTLADLTAAFGRADLAERCRAARALEDRHVTQLRTWLADRADPLRDVEREPGAEGGAAP